MIPTVFSDKYYAQTPTQSMKKLPHVAMAAKKNGLAKIYEPVEDVRERLKRLHNPHYVEDFLSGCGMAGSQGWRWSKEIREGVLSINSGQLRAAGLAFEHGISANVAQGFHHALWGHGMGFCTFNGLALIAQEYPNQTICIIDADEHQGNGTKDFTLDFENLWNFTIFGTPYNDDRKLKRNFDFQLPRITENWDLYLEALDTTFLKIIEDARPDLIIYQAGADPHIDDPLSTLEMTTKQMRERDRMVFEFTKESKIPTMFVLAGGYQEMDNLVSLHVTTFEEAKKAYF
jgi:acetoin utilization deacetylase AcuC-like enzyme